MSAEEIDDYLRGVEEPKRSTLQALDLLADEPAQDVASASATTVRLVIARSPIR